jgi:putative transcriptional regulator
MSESLRGHFLIASCRLRDPNFFKTVVLIVEHNEECAMGLVVNRPSSISVENALSGNFDLPTTGELVHCGGPVEGDTYFVLHNTSEFDDDEHPVCGGLYVGNSPAVFEEVVRRVSSSAELKFRVYSGCAGWGPGQLEGELARGDWFTIPASEEIVFHEDPYVVWDFLMRHVYEANRLVPHSSKNPEWN